MFACGLIIGAVISFFITFCISVEAFNEKDREIKYLWNQLALQAEAEREKNKKRKYYGGIEIWNYQKQ